MDPIADVLATVRVSTTQYCRSELTAPWGLSFPRRAAAVFHGVRNGACWLRLEAAEPIPLAAGDLALLPRSDAHVLSSGPHVTAEDIFSLLSRRGPSDRGPVIYGGGGERVELLCGQFAGAAEAMHPVMSMLPPVIVLRNEKGRVDSWVESTLDMLSHESSRRAPGADAVIARATDMLFVQAIRVYLSGADERVCASLRGLADARIASALAAIHRRPADPWTVDDLASTAAMSRSAFCERFRGLVGEPPHKYLTRWRIQTAAAALHEREATLSELAERAGFQDEAAFSRAFKRYIGMSPRAYRRSRAMPPP